MRLDESSMTPKGLDKVRPFNTPGYDEVVKHAGVYLEKIRNILKILIEQEQLVRIDRDLLFHRDAVERARETLVTYITKQGCLESVKFKYLLDTTRKYAIPLLDYFDRIGVTRRSGYTRYLRASK